MRLSAVPADADPREEINLTPMLDVVFILLIFFIVTASFLRETGLTVGGTDNEAIVTGEPEAVVVLVDADDAFWIDRRRVEPGALRAHLALARASHPEFPVVIQAASESSVQALVRALDIARAAGYADVAVTGAAAAAPPPGNR